MYKGKIPFNPFTKEPLDYCERYVHKDDRSKPPEMIDNYVFSDALKYDTFSRGRSAANIVFKSITSGLRYTVFLVDFSEMVPLMVSGVVYGNFEFCKRGMNYGLKLSK